MGSGTAEGAHASKLAVRIWAWALGALSFLAPLALLGLYPKPAQADGGATVAQAQAAKPKRPVVIIVTRKKIIQDAPKPSVTSSGGGGVSYVYAPTAAPAAVSCGTHPC